MKKELTQQEADALVAQVMNAMNEAFILLSNDNNNKTIKQI